jgi:crotonobetainyl-CoA:carnitine CoA-transferase CaiB-like acyl-CoA transferase
MCNKGALSGITVLDLSRLLPGPYCSMILADHGARVIAIESKRFKADDFFITTVNRNKEHMTLDLKTSEGQQVFDKLAGMADVILEGFRPDVTKRIGIDYPAIRKKNPAIIYCSITGYGQDGPLRDRAGHDVNYLAVSGVLDLMGEADRLPSIPGIQIADIAGGALNAALGILIALTARAKTGKGQYIDISMTDGMVSMLALQLYLSQRSGEFPKRGDTQLAHRYACYNTYETKDGRYISIGAVENRFWRSLCELLDKPEYISLQYDDERRTEISDFMRIRFKQHTLAKWEDTLKNVECCWAPVKTMQEVLADPVFRNREMVLDNPETGDSSAPVIGLPIKLSETPGSIRTSPVGFGGSTVAILKELGYSKSRIKALEEKDVI